MNLNAANFVYSFKTDAVIKSECKCEGKTVVENAVVLPPKTPRCKIILKYNSICNHDVCCIPTNNVKHTESKEKNNCLIGAINDKRLCPSWRKKVTLQRKHCYHLLQNEGIKTENKNLYYYLSIDKPRISFTTHDGHQQILRDPYCYRISNKNCRSIISKRKLSMCSSLASKIKYTRFSEKNEQNRVDITENNKNKEKVSLSAKRFKFQRWHYLKHRTRILNSILDYVRLIMAFSFFQPNTYKISHVLFIIVLTLTQYLSPIQGLLMSKSSSGEVGLNLAPIYFDNGSDMLVYNNNGSSSSSNNSINNRFSKNANSFESGDVKKGDLYLPASKSLIITSSTEGRTSNGAYLDKLDNLERSLAAVLIKVAYGTTSTTKRSIPENSYVPSLTTIATPLLTTLRYNLFFFYYIFYF